MGPCHRPDHLPRLQHFITHAVWDADRIWRRLLEVTPERRGVLIIDGTSFPKQGTHSFGVARQYCGALGKIANCQVAVTAALWTAARAWMTGALLYLPKPWLTDADWRKLAAWAYRPGRRALREVATIVTPDTLLRWHRQPIARKWT